MSCDPRLLCDPLSPSGGVINAYVRKALLQGRLLMFNVYNNRGSNLGVTRRYELLSSEIKLNLLCVSCSQAK